MNYILLAFKGLIIGIAKIIPGVSGAMLSISLGVYERVLDIIGHPLKAKLDDFKFLFFLLIGVSGGIILFSMCVKWCLSQYYIPTMLFFAGLIIGGLPEITSEFQKNDYKFSSIVIFLISFILILIFTNLSSGSNDSINHYFLMGVIESLTTIIPGISGTAIFMALGWYESLLDVINSILTFKAPFSVSFLFILGFIVSTIMVCRVLNFVFRRYKPSAYFCVLGFMGGSLWAMFDELLKNSFNISELITGILLFILGIVSTVRINNFFSKF